MTFSFRFILNMYVFFFTLPLTPAFFLEPFGLPLPRLATGACSSSEDLAESFVLVAAGGRPRFLSSFDS